MKENSERRPGACPRCGSRKVGEIVYGLPSPELVETGAKEGIVLGGCCVEPDSPAWHCRTCGLRWGHLGEWSHLVRGAAEAR